MGIGKFLHIILLSLLLCIASQLLQAQAKFYTLVSESTIALRQTFQVQYVIEGASSVRQLVLPRFGNFEIEETFDYSSSTSYNHKGLNSYSKIIVLLATKKGKFTIPGAEAVVDGKSMRSNDVQVTVKQGAPGMNNISPDDIDTEHESELRPGESINDKIQKNFFLRVEPSKTTCYVGEPLMVVYKAYSRLNANSQVVRRPSLTGFSVMEMVDAYDGKPEIEKLEGRYYYTNLIRKVQLFPLQDGNYVLDPAEIESVIHFIKTDDNSSKRNSLSRLFDRSITPLTSQAVDYRTILRTAPLTITVKPLPTANQPADFSGAVGQFALAVKPPPGPVHKGDLVKIQLVVSGSGNLSLLTPPFIKWPKGVDTAEPSVKENVNKYVFPLSGSKTFEYSFAATDTGDIVIPAVRLPYYDPAEKKYKMATSDTITMHVLPGVNKTDPQHGNGISGGVAAVRPQFYWFALIAVIILASIGYQIFSSGRGKRGTAQKQPAVAEPKETPLPQQPAQQILLAAQQALQQEHRQAFYHEIQKALWEVMAARYHVLPSQMNKHHIAALLAQKGVPPGIVQNFTAVLDECEWALYTPSHDIQDMTALLAKAEQVVNDVVV